MENVINDMTALFIEIKYENHYESIYQDKQDTNELKYRDYIQDEFNSVYDKIKNHLSNNQIN